MATRVQPLLPSWIEAALNPIEVKESAMAHKSTVAQQKGPLTLLPTWIEAALNHIAMKETVVAGAYRVMVSSWCRTDWKRGSQA